MVLRAVSRAYRMTVCLSVNNTLLGRWAGRSVMRFFSTALVNQLSINRLLVKLHTAIVFRTSNLVHTLTYEQKISSVATAQRIAT